MKYTFSLFLTLFLFLFYLNGSLMAQNIGFKTVGLKYLQPPSAPLDAEYTTYSTSVSALGSDLRDAGITETSLLRKHLDFVSKKYVPRGGHLHIEVNVDFFRIESEETKKTTKKTKKKDGTEVTTTYYSKEIKYTMPLGYTITNFNGEVLEEKTISTRRDQRSYSFDKKHVSEASLNQGWNNARANMIVNQTRSHVNSNFASIGRMVRGKYDYVPVDRPIDLAVLKTKKSDDYDGFQKAFETVEQGFALLDYYTTTEAAAEKLQSTIDYFNDLKKKYSPTDKKEKKVNYACSYNNAVIYYALDQMDMAQQHINDCEKIDWKDNKAEGLAESITRTKELFELNQKASRHMAFDFSGVEAPGGGGMVGGGAETVYAGEMVLTSGETLQGEFVIDYGKYNYLNFRPDGNVRFIGKKDGKFIERTLNPEQVSSFSFNGQNFQSIEFTPATFLTSKAGGSITSLAKGPGKQIMEILYDNPKMMVYKYYAYKLDYSEEIALKKASDERPTSTDNIRFLNFRKALGKFYTECAALVSKIENGDFENAEGSLVEAARFYVESCE